MDKYRLSEQPRRVEITVNGQHYILRMRQIIATRNFANVHAGDVGGWVDSMGNLSQQDDCWIYDQNSLVFNGASVTGNARIIGPCQISDNARVSDQTCIEASEIGDNALISQRANVHHSRVFGQCVITGEARVLNNSHIQATMGMTPCGHQQLRIDDRATVSASRVVHQAQIFGHAIVNHGFIEHRAQIFDNAILEGNGLNNVWVCDQAKVYGSARIIAGTGDDEIPTLRYSSQVYGDAMVSGNCLLRHQVRVYDHASLAGGPLELDNHVNVYGHARIIGNVLIENDVQVFESASIEAFDGYAVHIQGQKNIHGDQRITRTSFTGVY